MSDVSPASAAKPARSSAPREAGRAFLGRTSSSGISTNSDLNLEPVEPAEWSGNPMVLEDVVVSNRSNAAVSQPSAKGTSSGLPVPPAASGISLKDVEKMVDDAVSTALTRAVRQALNEKLPELRQAIVNEVSERAAEQVGTELTAVRKNLREQMLSEIREMSTQWLRKETPNLAKDVIREEIRKVIESI
jgi:hypothetical protein